MTPLGLPEIQRSYQWMAPVYDALFGRAYQGLRRESIDSVELNGDDSVVLVGLGTGLDLRLLPAVKQAIGIDVSRAMLLRARRKRHSSHADLVMGDGAHLPLRSASVSVVILHLVLCASPDGRVLLREATRALVPGGRLAILDHFATGREPARWRQLASRFQRLLGTRLDRSLAPMLEGLPVHVRHDRRRANGLYRLILLERTQAPPA